jgi:hypothetical protein
MVLHQRFCVQNIKYCEKCQVGVIIEEFEEHLQSHKSKENSKEKSHSSKEENDSLTLKRVQSSKIGCEYCGFLCGFGDIEEHEAMCGARSTNCKQCGKRLLIKDLKDHIEKVHKLNMENYQEMKSKSFENNFNSNSNSYNNSGLYGNLGNLDLKRMTTDEEIAYAMALSQEEELKRQQKEKEKEKNKYNEKQSDNFKKNNSLEMKKKKSEKIDYDELEYEYQKQMYEDEMDAYNEENEENDDKKDE